MAFSGGKVFAGGFPIFDWGCGSRAGAVCLSVSEKYPSLSGAVIVTYGHEYIFCFTLSHCEAVAWRLAADLQRWL